MKKIWPLIIIVLVIVAVVVALALHKSTNSTDNNMGMTPQQMAAMNHGNSNKSGSQPTATDKVTIQNFAFSPADITVKAGTTVTWTNQDSTEHTVTADSGSGPNSQPLAKGQSYSFKFDTAGTYSYHCSIHPDMTGKVVVTQ